mmetsp:Transcript_149451/g.260689  ORF Transcript_149451/g.260689 Transcript_149451/m.260689 type:complete len:93 (+) Transcript_149451:532-810(+)
MAVEVEHLELCRRAASCDFLDFGDARSSLACDAASILSGFATAESSTGAGTGAEIVMSGSSVAASIAGTGAGATLAAPTIDADHGPSSPSAV